MNVYMHVCMLVCMQDIISRLPGLTDRGRDPTSEVDHDR